MPILRFLRLPGVFTALADILAGYLILRFAGSGEGALSALPVLLGASACLYMAGMAWNDVFDAETDKDARPDRPIPRGDLSLTTGYLIAVVFSIAGLLLSMTAGSTSFFVAAALLILILFYDGGGKRIEVIGPLAMGGCRGLNLLLGMSLHAEGLFALSDNGLLAAPIILAAYTLALTVIASFESPPPQPSIETPVPGDPESPDATSSIPAADAPSSQMPTEMASVSAVVVEEESASPATLWASPEPPAPDCAMPVPLVLVGGLALLLAPAAVLWLFPARPLAVVLCVALMLLLAAGLRRILAENSTASIRALVGSAISGIVLLDAGMVATQTTLVPATVFGYPVWGLPADTELAGVVLVTAMILPAMALQRRITVT